MDVVAVDWSGAAQSAAAHIWLAHVHDGELVELRNGRSRTEVIGHLTTLRSQSPGGLVVGLDFSFSFPIWFMRQRSFATVDDLWDAAGREGEQWLADCNPPFWGRKDRHRPDLPEHFRRAEQDISVGGIRPKSVFQIGGPGTVGTGTIRGMPHLRQLHDAGYSIWPFHPPSPWTAVEIYPRLLTGPVHKSDREHRSRYLGEANRPIAAPFARSVVDSEDAFDAAFSALAMHDHRTYLADLGQTTDPVTLLEGDVWRPPPTSRERGPQK
jgi:hypothetical protein